MQGCDCIFMIELVSKMTNIQDCVRLARSYELINIIHCVGSLRINCFNFKLAFVLLRWIIYALAYFYAKHKR